MADDKTVAATVVAFDPSSEKVLVQGALGGQVTLPQLTFHGNWPPMDSSLLDAFAATTGVRGDLLEPLDFTTVVIGAAAPCAVAEGYLWVEKGQITRQSAIVDDWLRRSGEDRPAWFRTGWLEAADRYLDEVIKDLGRSRTGPTRQVKHWSMSAVICAPTDSGALYLKAVLPRLAHEPVITAYLRERGVGKFAQIVAHSTTDHWWVAEDFGNADGWSAGSAQRALCLRQLAKLQVALHDKPDELLQHGCESLGLTSLSARIPELLARDDLWEAANQPRNRSRALSADERLNLRSLEGFLLDCCDQLAGGGVPLSLTHGDFHPGNVVVQEDGILLHDWSFASVSVPLFDLVSWLHDATEEEAALYLEEYLQAWSEVVGPEELRRAWKYAKPLAAVTEILKMVALADEVGPSYDFNWLPMTYGWARRLISAAADRDMVIQGWRN